MPKRDFDYIIAGAGAAGLSLLWRLLDDVRFADKKILLIDRSFKWEQEKTWCFWNDSFIPFKELISHSWNGIEVRSKGHLFSQNDGHYSYHCINSKPFRQHIIELARLSKQVTLLETNILSFGESSKGGTVETSAGTFAGEWIFQSLQKELLESQNPNPVLQHFKGHLIKTQKPIFSSKTMTLMDFNVMPDDQGKTAFFYVLPFSENKALIEYTLFSPKMLSGQAYDLAICWYLENRFKLRQSDYTVIESEIGSIPMDNTRIKPYINSRTVSIGTSGGATKPTTGYTFTRIQHHSNEIIEALSQNKVPPPYPETPGRFRFYDRLLLHILRTNATASPGIFHELFKHNSIDHVLRFLDEKSSLAQEMRIFGSLPWWPFLAAIFQNTTERNSP